MQKFDLGKTRAHRLKEAEAGFPLLRGCPNTDAIGRLAFLDSLGDADRIAFANQFSDFQEAQTADRNQPMEAPLRKAPLVEAFLEARRPPAHGVAFPPVKLYAGVCKDTGVGGFEGWAKMVGMPESAKAPARAHAASLEELVPVAPRRLRKLIDDALTGRFGAQATRISSDHTRYGAPLTGGGFTVDVLFARGMGASHQFEHHFNARMASGRSVWMESYEGVWSIGSRWDYVTETNAEKSVAHFIRLIETCIELI
jgi:hypothetical protein